MNMDEVARDQAGSTISNLHVGLFYTHCTDERSISSSLNGIDTMSS